MSSNNHKAVICRIKTGVHPNADRLQKGWVAGFEVIVGKDVADGTLGIYFPEDLRLSTEYAQANDLIRRKDAAGNNAGGMFEENCRVRTQKFRGEKSEGYWAELTSLNFTGGDIATLAEGDFVDEFNGVKLCEKYYSKKTQGVSTAVKAHKKGETVMFKKHFDTEQLRFYFDKIAEGSQIVITEKVHGTSFRYGNVLAERKLTWYDKVARFFGVKVQEQEWVEMNGTRNVIVEEDKEGFYSNEFRWRSVAALRGKLPRGCVVYGEIVGWEGPDKPIMPSVKADKKLLDKDFVKKYGDTITYKYGCPNGELDLYVYRITYPTVDGKVIDLPWVDVKRQCEAWGVKYVPEVREPFIYKTPGEDWINDYNELVHQDNLQEVCDKLIEGPSTIDPSHIREGVCLRVDTAFDLKVYKHKSFTFKLLEGIVKDTSDVVDMEEAS